MPKEITRWYCDLCNSEFDTQDEAHNCEYGHSHLKKITSEEYVGASGHWGFLDAPMRFYVQMSDGTKIMYVRHQVIED